MNWLTLNYRTSILCIIIGILSSIVCLPAYSENAITTKQATSTLLLDSVNTGNNIIAIGWRGHIIISPDKGDSWQQVKAETRYSLTALTFSDNLLGWAVGHNSTILHTKDGGKTWKKQFEDLNLKKALFDVWFKNKNEGWAVGSLGLALQTTDGGKTWKDISELLYNPDQYHYYSVAGTNTGTLYVVGERDYTMSGGLIFQSTNAGKDWQQLPPASEGTLFGVAISPNQKEVYVYGILGNIYKSLNNGSSFTKIPLDTRESITHLSFTNTGAIIGVGAKGLVFTSADRKNFKHHYEQARNDFTSVLPISDHIAVVTGPKGIATIQLAH